MKILIQNGTIVTAADIYRADILIEHEKIAQIGENLPADGAETVINAENRYIFPGGIDVHTHLELPSMGTVSADDFLSGSKAAICGGTTTFIDFIDSERSKPLLDSYETWQKKAKGKAVADYAFHMVVKEFNDSIAEQMPEIIAKGITSFKCFFAYENMQIDDSQFIQLIQQAGKLGVLVMVHAENGSIIKAFVDKFISEGKTEPVYHHLSHPASAEAEAVNRAVKLATTFEQSVYIVHLSSANGLDSLKNLAVKGCKFIAETCPQYLLLSDDLYFKSGFESAKWIMSPPLRPQYHQEKLWDGIDKGIITIIATDHCPFNFKEQKELGKNDFTKIPNGIGSIGDRFNLLYSYGVGLKRISLNKFVDLVATAPAKTFGLYPRKGSIIVGGDADIVIFDPKAEKTIRADSQVSNCDYNAYEGFKLTGFPESVLLRGKFAVKNGEYVGQQGFGKYIPRKPQIRK